MKFRFQMKSLKKWITEFETCTVHAYGGEMHAMRQCMLYMTVCGLSDRATPEKFFSVSLAYVRGLEGSQKAC